MDNPNSNPNPQSENRPAEPSDRPAFYRTWWFWLLIILLVLVLIFARGADDVADNDIFVPENGTEQTVPNGEFEGDMDAEMMDEDATMPEDEDGDEEAAM